MTQGLFEVQKELNDLKTLLDGVAFQKALIKAAPSHRDDILYAVYNLQEICLELIEAFVPEAVK